MTAESRMWLLSCGHETPMLQYEREGYPPPEPRGCPECKVPRNVVMRWQGNNIHPQVTIRRGDVAAEVDEAMAPLILELWRQGFSTAASCISFPAYNDLAARSDFDAGEYAYVGFTNAEDQERFYRAVKEVATVATQRLIVGQPKGIAPADAAYHAAWSVGFPNRDLAAVVKAVEAQRKAEEQE